MVSTMEELARYELLADLIRQRDFTPWDVLPHQIPPDDDDWWFWLLEAGRGAGKTAAAAHWVQDHLNGPACITGSLPHRGILIAPTIGDGIESASLNDQALTRLEPGAKLRQSAGGTRVDWPNGSMVRVVGTSTREDIDRLRAAGNTCFAWFEEWASWRRLAEAMDIALPGLRVGPNPRIVATTTPKARPEYIEARKTADVVMHATLRENPFLNEKQAQRLLDRYEGTSIGEQEIEGKLIEEAEGALWTLGLINDNRLPNLYVDWVEDVEAALEALDTNPLAEQPPPPPWDRTVVAIDPPGGKTEAGIIVVGETDNCPCGGARSPHWFVLADYSGKLSPEGWGSRGVEAYYEWASTDVVGETNYGGDMVQAIIRNADDTVKFDSVTASRGKRIRAEPVKGLYEQGRVHHVGLFPEAEGEMVLWVPDESDWSPNRLDALVWGITYLSSKRRSDWWSA